MTRTKCESYVFWPACLYSCCCASNPSIICIHQASQPESSPGFLNVSMQVANGNKTRYCWKEGGSHILLYDAFPQYGLLHYGETGRAEWTSRLT